MTGDTGIHEQMIGDDGGQGTVNALSIVSAELMETIRNAHLALEDCVDGRGGTAALVRSGELLHQASGALRMSETFGAALLVEEMELCCKFLTALRSGKGREDGLDALTRAMVQLPNTQRPSSCSRQAFVIRRHPAVAQSLADAIDRQAR
jgi:chemosensory pili system protein ChpA (sensor histidine kinase/response regulator)